MEVKDDKQESERLDMRDEQSTLFEAPGSRSPSSRQMINVLINSMQVRNKKPQLDKSRRNIMKGDEDQTELGDRIQRGVRKKQQGRGQIRSLKNRTR